MARNLGTILAVFIAALAALLPVHSGARAHGARPLLVIIGGSSGLTNISSSLLRRAFEGYPAEYAWGKRLIPFNQPTGSAARVAFDKNVLGLGPDEVGRFWIDQRVRSAAEPPRTVPSQELAVRVVASLPGAISYATADLLNPLVRALTIDGKGPSDPDYLFAR